MAESAASASPPAAAAPPRAARAYDVVVFGASGFTGQRVVEYLKAAGGTWAVALAGRSAEKLAAVNARWQTAYPTVVADVGDAQSLAAMAAQARLVINCVGPFRFYGEAVVKACAEAGTDYIDISGEPEFIEKMELEYSAVAAKNGCTIVSSCGFDSIPADLGTIYAVQQLPPGSTPATVESFLNIKPGKSGLSLHYATYECIVHGFGSVSELRALRRKMPKVEVPTTGPKLPILDMPHWNEDAKGYCMPFPGADASVVKRSQRGIVTQKIENVKPVQYAAYFTVPSAMWTGVVAAAGGIFGGIANFEFGRKMLLKYPKLFSLGVFSHEGPTEEQLKETTFEMLFITRAFSSAEVVQAGKPDLKLRTRVAGPEPGYIATPIFAVEAARALLDNRDAVPKGVFTPAVAFHNTNYVALLQGRGITFEVVPQEATA